MSYSALADYIDYVDLNPIENGPGPYMDPIAFRAEVIRAAASQCSYIPAGGVDCLDNGLGIANSIADEYETWYSQVGMQLDANRKLQQSLQAGVSTNVAIANYQTDYNTAVQVAKTVAETLPIVDRIGVKNSYIPPAPIVDISVSSEGNPVSQPSNPQTNRSTQAALAVLPGSNPIGAARTPVSSVLPTAITNILPADVSSLTLGEIALGIGALVLFGMMFRSGR